jgi:diguanylate cyclase (GGDEF)-like protein
MRWGGDLFNEETDRSGAPLRDLMAFHSIARALTSSLDRDSVLRAIMAQMERFFRPESWSLLLVDPVRNDLYYAVAAGQSDRALRSVRIPLGTGLAGWVAEHGEPLIVTGSEAAARRSDSEAAPEEVRSAICLPLRVRDCTLGVLQLFNYPLNSLTDYAITFLHILSDYAAIAIDNARAVERIQELTVTDDCTGLFNMRHLHRSLEAEVERARRFEAPLSVIFLDLDRFKRINDRHGHLAGSRLLAEIGSLLRDNLRVVDLAFRYGGDEFVILLPQTPKQAAVEAAARLLLCLRHYRFLAAEGLHLPMVASFGIACFPDDADSAEDLIRCADEMMYAVKNSTRNGIAVAPLGVLAGADELAL